MRLLTKDTSSSRRSAPLVALLMALSLVAAACGTTAEPESESAGDRTRSEADGGTIDEPGGEPEAEEERTEAGRTTRDDAGGAADPGEPGQAEAPSAPDGDGGDGPSTAGASAQGLEDDTIRIGFEIVDDDAGETNRQLGIGDVAARDEDREAFVNLIVDDINSRGGVAGREVEPVIHASDENDSAEVRAQRTCAAFTEDNEVFTVSLYSHFTNGSVRRCLQERGVPMVTGGLSLADDLVFEQTDKYLEVENLSLTRVPKAQIQGLVQQGFFDDSGLGEPTRIGLVRLDTPPFERATEESLKPALAQHGLELDEEVAVTHSQSNQQLGGQANEVNNAVLRFRSSGITHVMFLQDRPSASLFFMMQAESQGYRPLYGLNTQDGGQLIANSVPPEQLEGAMGVGWKPFIDVPTGEDPGTNDAREHCLELMRDGGQEFTDRNSMLVAQVHCDMGYFIQQAGDAAPQPLTTDSFMDGIRSLGTSFEAGQTWRTNFGDSLDGVAAYRTTAYSMDCECFQYTSDLREAPR